MTHIQGTTRVQ